MDGNSLQIAIVLSTDYAHVYFVIACFIEHNQKNNEVAKLHSYSNGKMENQAFKYNQNNLDIKSNLHCSKFFARCPFPHSPTPAKNAQGMGYRKFKI